MTSSAEIIIDWWLKKLCKSEFAMYREYTCFCLPNRSTRGRSKNYAELYQTSLHRNGNNEKTAYGIKNSCDTSLGPARLWKTLNGWFSPSLIRHPHTVTLNGQRNNGACNVSRFMRRLRMRINEWNIETRWRFNAPKARCEIADVPVRSVAMCDCRYDTIWNEVEQPYPTSSTHHIWNS